MFNSIRKNQQWLMALVTIVIIVAFVFLYNQTDLEKLGSSSMGSAYGKKVTSLDFSKASRQFEIARELQLFELLQTLAVGPSREPAEEYFWNTQVLRNQAALLQIEPSDDAVAQRIKELPAFQKDGQFDLATYQQFVTVALTPRGFTTNQLEELIRDELRLKTLHDLVSSASVVPEGEVREAFANAYRKRHLQVVKLSSKSFENVSAPTADEIKAHFDKNQAQFQSDEKRALKYVAFILSESEAALTGKERVAVLQPISEKADEFSQRLLKPGANFDAIATELGVEIKTTALFSSSTPPTELADIPQLSAAAFSLTKESPDSDVFQTDKGFYLLHLIDVQPSVPQTLEEATAKISEILRQEKINTALQTKAAELGVTFALSLQLGKSFTETAQTAGLEVLTLPAYSPADLQAQQSEFTVDRLIQARAASVAEKTVSDFIPTPDGGAFAYIEKIDPLDDAKWNSEKEAVLDRYTSSKREVTVNEWFRARRAAANFKSGPQAS